MAPSNLPLDATDLGMSDEEMQQLILEQEKILARIDESKRPSVAMQQGTLHQRLHEHDCGDHCDSSSWPDDPSQAISIGALCVSDSYASDHDSGNDAAASSSIFVSSSCAREPRQPDYLSRSADPSYPDTPEFSSSDRVLYPTIDHDDDLLQQQHAIMEEIERQRRGANDRGSCAQPQTTTTAAAGPAHLTPPPEPSLPLTGCSDEDMAILREQQAILDEIERKRNGDARVSCDDQNSKSSHRRPISFCSLPKGPPATIYEQDGEASVDSDHHDRYPNKRESSLDKLKSSDKKGDGAYHLYHNASYQINAVSSGKHMSSRKNGDSAYRSYHDACQKIDDTSGGKHPYIDEKSDAELVAKLKNDIESNAEQFGKLQLYPDQNLNILDRTRSIDAVRSGTANSAKCSSCFKRYMVAFEATMLYCPVCEILTPVESHGRGHVRGHKPPAKSDGTVQSWP